MRFSKPLKKSSKSYKKRLLQEPDRQRFRCISDTAPSVPLNSLFAYLFSSLYDLSECLDLVVLCFAGVFDISNHNVIAHPIIHPDLAAVTHLMSHDGTPDRRLV